MAMSITEASAVQDLLHLLAEAIADLRREGHTDDETIIATETGRTIDMGSTLLRKH